jgi:hypothetical protein
MSPSTDSSASTVATATDDVIDPAGGDSTGRAFGRVRGQRLEITPADLTMYSVITGRAPSAQERERALTWTEHDPLNDQIAGVSGTAVTAVVPAHAMRPWHPMALSLRVRELWFNGFTIRVNRPQLSHWMRRFSLALQQGRRRVRQPR